MARFNRITQEPGMMGGKPCIRGMRVTVGMIVGMTGAGHSIDEILSDYPYLDREDILQSLRYAAPTDCRGATADGRGSTGRPGEGGGD